jgi:hypothetical protein
MRPFWLQRVEDESGVSGEGLVAEGVVFSSGWCALTWLTGHKSVAFYPSLEEVEAIHGHDGKTKIITGAELSCPT